MRIEIPGKPPTINQIYAGAHWAERKKIKDAWRWRVKAALTENPQKPVEHYPVTVEVIVQFTGRRYDWENCAFAAKLVQDALIAEGILENDSPPYISRGTLIPIKGPEDKVIYVIYQARPQTTEQEPPLAA